jgi:hypothetical protein
MYIQEVDIFAEKGGEILNDISWGRRQETVNRGGRICGDVMN